MIPHKRHWLLRVRPAFLASALKKSLRVKRRVVETQHGRFFIDPASTIGDAILSDRGYEPNVVRTLQSLLNVGDAFLDIGANEGYFSVIASKLVGPQGKVVSIEPQSRLQSVIFRNIAENSAFNVCVIQCAVSDKLGMANLFLLPDVNTGGSSLSRPTSYRVRRQLVPQTTLRRLLDLINLQPLKLLKMDIEGFEHEVLLGAREVLASGRIENIALELHPRQMAQRGKSKDEILDLLKDCGYRRNKNHKSMVFRKCSDPADGC